MISSSGGFGDFGCIGCLGDFGGTYGPPFKDPKVQSEYDAQVAKLASNVVITKGTAQDLVGAVINSTMAAADSKTPEIVATVTDKVHQAVLAETPMIEARVRNTVLLILAGAVGVGALGYVAWRRFRAA